ncbi:MAG: DMT family transporter [Desulfovibrio sp.]|nr:DMT family transporter [Desulfovibrio sp.]
MAFTAIISAVLIWGSSFIIKPSLFAVVDPVQVVFVQSLGGVLLLGAKNLLERKNFHLGRSDALFVMVSGVLGIAVYQMLLNYAIKLLGGAICSILTALVPAMCLLVDIGVLKKNWNLSSLISIVLSFAGVLLIVSMSGAGELNLLGYAAVLFSNGVWIYYCYFTSRRKTNATSTVFLFYQLVGCALLLTPYMLLHPLDVTALIDWKTFWQLAYMVVLHGILVYYLFIFAVGKLDVVVTNIFVNLVPIVALACNYLFFHELINTAQATGTALVILAVMLNSRSVGK